MAVVPPSHYAARFTLVPPRSSLYARGILDKTLCSLGKKMDSDSILTEPRGVTIAWHLRQTRRLLAYDAGRQLDSVLVYAALELRSAIERYLCEVLLLLRNGKVTDDDAHRCRKIGGVFDLIKEADPLYRKTIAFTNIIASTLPEFSHVEMADTCRMHEFWSRLSEFCHKQLKPEKTFDSQGGDFQSRGFALLQEVLSHFGTSEAQGIGIMMAPGSMEPEVKMIYDKFVQNAVTEEAAKGMLLIAAPVLAQRRVLSDPIPMGGRT